MSVIRKIRHSLPQKSLVTEHTAFLSLLIDYRDILLMTQLKMNLSVKNWNQYSIKLSQ